MELTEHHDLRTGSPVWTDHDTPPPSDPLPDRIVDVAIVGAGIMGAMLGRRLARSGRSVALIDRRPPASGSTAASTALVMWEIDTPLTHLARDIGIEEAGRRWRRVYDAVQEAPIDRGRQRPVAYLVGGLLDAAAMRAEGAERRRFGLPSQWLEADAMAERLGIAPRAGLISDDCYAVDPVATTLDLLQRARADGATVTWPVDIARLETRRDGIALHHPGGALHAREAILAGGYERARMFLPPAFSLLSSYAVATAPAVAPLWREDALIWEASDPYLYARTDAHGRVIAGGEDVDFFAPESSRDRMIEAKSGRIAAKLEALLGTPVAVERRWAATFGTSPDGLPAIGRARNHQRLWLASGFGGNGVSFAALGAELIAAAMDGTPDPLAYAFDPYRFG